MSFWCIFLIFSWLIFTHFYVYGSLYIWNNKNNYLLEDLKMLQGFYFSILTFIMIYINSKTSELLKVSRILLKIVYLNGLLWIITDFSNFFLNIFFTIYNDETLKTWKRLKKENYRVWIHSKTPTWHDKNIQSTAQYR